MQESRSADKKGTSQLMIYLLIGVIIVVVFKINDPFHISFLLLAVIAYITYKEKKYIKLSIVDISLLLLILYELIAVNFSINKIASVPNLVRLSESLLFYAIIRALTIDKIEKLFNGLTLFIISILILSLTSFYLYIAELNKVDFGHYLNDMKFLYRPLGFLVNTWTSYLILFLGTILIYICIFKQNSKRILFYSIVASLLIFNIIVTFSRGAYVALAFIILSTYICVLIKKLRNKRILLCFLLIIPISVLVLSFPYLKDIQKTASLNKIVSQERSTSGRLQMNEVAKSIFEKNTFWGVGSANFSLAADSQLYEDGNTTFTNNSGSIINQMIAEKGVIGIIIYSLVICAILWQMFASRIKIDYLLVLLPLGAIFIRELTFPAFLENSGIQLLALILLALSQNLYTKENSKWAHKLHLQKIHIYIPITLYGLLIIFSLGRSKNEKYNEQLIIDISNRDLKNTKTHTDKLSDEVPYLINKSVVYREQYKADGEKEALQKSEDCLRLAIEKDPYNILLLNNLSVVCYENGKQEEAFTIQKELTEKYESNALYNLNLFSFYYQTGNTKEAIHNLQAAIEANPHILNTDFWTNIENDSTINTRHILENIDLSFSSLDDDPIKLAKYGVFLFYMKNYSKAKLSLKKSLEILPKMIIR